MAQLLLLQLGNKSFLPLEASLTNPKDACPAAQVEDLKEGHRAEADHSPQGKCTKWSVRNVGQPPQYRFSPVESNQYIASRASLKLNPATPSPSTLVFPNNLAFYQAGCPALENLPFENTEILTGHKIFTDLGCFMGFLQANCEVYNL